MPKKLEGPVFYHGEDKLRHLPARTPNVAIDLNTNFGSATESKQIYGKKHQIMRPCTVLYGRKLQSASYLSVSGVGLERTGRITFN